MSRLRSIHMGFFKESQEKQQQRQKREARAKAFAEFQRLIEQLHPTWSLTFGDSVTLKATCPYGQETLELEIGFFHGTITNTGDFNPGTPGCDSVNFCVRSPSVDMWLL